MADYFNLWQSTKDHICGVRKISYSGFIDRQAHECADHRAYQLFVLDVFLHEYRKKYENDGFPLAGVKALHHVILNRYQWTLKEIRELSLDDSLFVLQDQLKIENLSDGAQKFLKDKNLPSHFVSFDKMLDEDWDPDMAKLYLNYP